jgi:hypothetical protein
MIVKAGGRHCGERGEIAKQRVEAVHRERFAICRVGAFAGGLALRRLLPLLSLKTHLRYCDKRLLIL